MKKEYCKPVVEILDFQLKDFIMAGLNPDIGVDGSVGDLEGEGWE